ncbi:TRIACYLGLYCEROL ACIDIC LIPASE TAL5 [Salix viminalis]|uniref:TRIACYLGLYCEROL ACIDIC LIPASE TAL5 n=1 Tax=Salix viminalis TaxID=40686 RepID=A0A9Q0NU02_SALVM|nr:TRIACYLGLYCEROL ACIDIC LIPASE TAL5 [Salix viminalis]
MFQDTNANPNLYVVSFRGTEPFNARDWATDVDLSWYKFKGIGQIHRGFMKALGLQNNGWPKEIIEPDDPDHLYAYYETRQMLRDILSRNEEAKFIVTGHSLGGALAILFVAVLTMHGEAELLERLEGVYTFRAAKVPRLPFDNKILFYKHFWECKYYTSWYKEKVLAEEPNKNYFSLLLAIPKFLNAVWELIRSFIIPCLKGPDYREGWLMTLMRMVGLVIPGLPAHCPQDYTNATRLGS